MSRRLTAVALSAALVLLAGCGGGGDEKDPARNEPFAFPAVSTDKPGDEPTLVSSTEPPSETQSKVLHEGTGRVVGPDDVVVVNTKGQVWDKDGVDLPAFVNTFKTGQKLIRPVTSVVPAWAKVLPGQKVGSRVLMVAPPADGFGDEGLSGMVFPTDTVMFVVDIIDSLAPMAIADGKAVTQAPDANLPTVSGGKAPKITVPKVDPPADLVTKVLLQGDGAAVKPGETIVAEYLGVLWRDGKPFDSTWEAGRHPFAARIAKIDANTTQSGVIEGWVKAIVGQKVGTRLLLVVPPKLGYGKGGNSDAGIKGTDTLVFVVDILGAYGNAAT